MKNSQGFTLVELVITVAIIAVLASIAYGSYNQYIVRSAEAQAEAKMQSLAMELDRYRSSRLTYRGFVPRKVSASGGTSTETYAYDDDINSVYTNDTKNKYVIAITNISNQSLVNDDASFDGSGWVMFAKPGGEAMSDIKYKYIMTSTGQRCRSSRDDFKFEGTSTAKICVGAESW